MRINQSNMCVKQVCKFAETLQFLDQRSTSGDAARQYQRRGASTIMDIHRMVVLLLLLSSARAFVIQRITGANSSELAFASCGGGT